MMSVYNLSDNILEAIIQQLAQTEQTHLLGGEVWPMSVTHNVELHSALNESDAVLDRCL